VEMIEVVEMFLSYYYPSAIFLALLTFVR
jgi:hypothetical protein